MKIKEKNSDKHLFIFEIYTEGIFAGFRKNLIHERIKRRHKRAEQVAVIPVCK